MYCELTRLRSSCADDLYRKDCAQQPLVRSSADDHLLMAFCRCVTVPHGIESQCSKIFFLSELNLSEGLMASLSLMLGTITITIIS